MANYRKYKNLVTASEVIAATFTNENTDEYLISDDIITITELTHIKPVLGTKFYTELKNQNNGGTLTTDNQELMTYFLQPAEEWLVKFEVINEVQNNSTSAGIVQNISDFSNPLSPPQLADYVQDTYRKGRVMLNDMIEWLRHEDQVGKFPTYEQHGPCNNNSTWKNHGIIMYDDYREYNKSYRYWKYGPKSII